jgi:hypothetical protein
VVYLAQAFTRPGFDIGRHPASFLSNGDLGWIQIANFLVTGALLIAGAIGMRRALYPGRGATWGPLLIGLSGIGLILGGIFVADPADGFPPGTPPGPPESMTTTSVLHLFAALVGFLSWVAASFVFARRFAAQGERGWAWFSAISGGFLLLAFLGTASGAGPVMALVLGVILICAWIAATFARLMQEAPAG